MNIKEKALDNLIQTEIKNILESLYKLIDEKLDEIHSNCKSIACTDYRREGVKYPDYSGSYNELVKLKEQITKEYGSGNYTLDYQDIVRKIIEL